MHPTEQFIIDDVNSSILEAQNSNLSDQLKEILIGTLEAGMRELLLNFELMHPIFGDDK